MKFHFCQNNRNEITPARSLFHVNSCKRLTRHRNENISRSSHQRCSIKKDVLRNFTKFTGKHLCQSLLFNKVVGPRLATLLKKRLWHRCFSVKFVKFLRTPFLQNTSGGCFFISFCSK